jgi:hypothetical protein
MTSICLPAPLFLILRRLFNVFSAFSISQSYLASRWAEKIDVITEGEPEKDGSIEVGRREEGDVKGAELVEKDNNNNLSKDSAESSWDLLNKLKKALPAK